MGRFFKLFIMIGVFSFVLWNTSYGCRSSTLDGSSRSKFSIGKINFLQIGKMIFFTINIQNQAKQNVLPFGFAL